MSYRLIDANALAANYKQVNDMPCIYADFLEFDEIVRCRDCKYYEAVPEDSGDWCGYWTDRIYADAPRGSGFCAWGVKEES